VGPVFPGERHSYPEKDFLAFSWIKEEKGEGRPEQDSIRLGKTGVAKKRKRIFKVDNGGARGPEPGKK